MIVIAATPFSPTYFNIVQLKNKVVIPVTSDVAISEQPFETAFFKTEKQRQGFVK